jgi:TetR/AcrR family transcriptional regulator, transcriptional repressor for nem operon
LYALSRPIVDPVRFVPPFRASLTAAETMAAGRIVIFISLIIYPLFQKTLLFPFVVTVMPRVSKDQAEANRVRVAKAAARLYREGGIERTSVAEIMEEAGMTIGAFHRQFGSKEALAVEACQHAFTEVILDWQRRVHEGGASQRTFTGLTENYLSSEHRDDGGTGCATAALAGDIMHEPSRSPLRQAFVAGVQRCVGIVVDLLPTSLSKKKRQQRALGVYATLVGALVIARATRGDAISDEILVAAEEAVKLLRNA